MDLLEWVARSHLGRLIIAWIFAHMSFAIPVQRLRETDTLLAFHHPRPSYGLHILLVPKKPLRGLADLSPGDDAFLTDVFRAAQSLVAEFQLDECGYRLILNGGEYQEVPQLHFHLISEHYEEREEQSE
jgi:histidine triad (HIT) family protein